MVDYSRFDKIGDSDEEEASIMPPPPSSMPAPTLPHEVSFPRNHEWLGEVN